jgi:hypothetical protein
MTAPTDLMKTTITVNVALGGVPTPRAGFGTVLIVSPDCAPPGGALTRTYSSATAATQLAADLTAVYITAAIKRAVETAFLQARRPATVKVGKVTALVAPSALAVDMAAIYAADQDFYGVCLDASVVGVPIAVQATIDANIMAMALWCEANDRLYCAMDYDVLVYAAGGGAAAALKALSYENTAFVWSQMHDAAAPGTEYQYADVAALARWLAFDPDDYAAPFRAPLTGIVRAKTTAAYVDLTAAEIAFAQGHNANIALLFGSAAAFLDKGININGRDWQEVLSKHWLQARVREDLADIVVDRAARGLPFPLSSEGVAICSAVINRRLQQGVAVGRFSETSVGSAVLDLTNKRITLSASATVLGSAREFVFNVDFLR